jgi:hypothetical protein
MTGDCKRCDAGDEPTKAGIHAGTPYGSAADAPCTNLDLFDPAARVVRAFLATKSRALTADLRKALETVLLVADEDARELERLKAGIRQVHHDVDEGLLRLIEEWPSA